jgi:hypothetical protein
VVAPQSAPPASNGFAVTALVLGIVGAVFGLIPLFFLISIPCGVLALIFGFAGRGRVGRAPGTPGRGMAIAGIVLGFVGLGLGIVGVVIVSDAFDDLEEEIEEIDEEP